MTSSEGSLRTASIGREHMEGEAAIAERVITPQASYRIVVKAIDLAIKVLHDHRDALVRV